MSEQFELKMDPALKARVLQFLSGIQQMPALPDVYVKVKQAFDNPSVSVEYIANAIRLDQALTLSILRLANSPFFGFRNKISSISQAVMLIGLREIYSIVLSISVMGLFPASKDKSETLFPLRAFWEHSLGVAVAARCIAKKLRYANPEELFVAGLIHDIGKVIEKMYLPNEFLKVCETCKEQQTMFYHAERDIIGFTHTEIGALLAEQWAFPPILYNIVAYHHQPSLIQDVKLNEAVTIVHVADALTRALGIGWSGDPYVPYLDPAIFAHLKIDIHSELEPLLFKIQHEYQSAIQSIFG